jgi:PKD repeat protein
MKKRGVSRCAALLLVLLMMMSTAAMLPSQDATAQTHKIWGFVKTTNPVSPLEGALVSLADVHGLDPSQQTGPDGAYEFTVGPGFYEIEVSMDGYFSQMYGPFRFDGDNNMRIPDFYLEQTPPKDWEFSGTVLSSVTAQVTRELVDFNTESMPKENVTSTFNVSDNTVDLSNPRIVYSSYTGWWSHPLNGTDNTMVEGTDCSIDLWTGVVTIANVWIISELTIGTNGSNGWIDFIYDHSDNTSYLGNGYITALYQAYKNDTPWAPAGNYVLDVESGLVDVQGNFIFGKDILEFDYEYHTPIQGASLTLYNVTKDHVVGIATSDNFGRFSIQTWAGAFELQTEADGYQTKVTSIQISGDQDMWIIMTPAIVINGWVTDDTTSSPVNNVRAYMFCTDSVPESMKLLEADVSGSYFEFDAFPGNFRLIVDADGYQAQYSNITVLGDEVHDFSLMLSDEETVDTSIGFVSDDWNNITIYKNLTLNNDSHLPSLRSNPLGSLELEIDLTVGDGDGSLTPTEWSDFETWLEDRGPQFLTTFGLFTTEGQDYMLELQGMVSRYNVTETHDAENVWIATKAWYNTTGITLDEDTYNLELKAAYDKTIIIEGEDRILTNYTYQIALPFGYELIWNSSMNTDVIGFTDIFIDPKKGVGTGTVILTVGKSEIGIAIAEVTGPLEGESDLYVYIMPESTPEDYVAIVPAETEIQFSAAASTDPNGPNGQISEHASFTWLFGDGDTGYGIAPVHNYSDDGTSSANYTVNLTIEEPGGEFTYSEINVRVDARKPVAMVWFDENDFEDENSQMHVDEDIDFDFGANLSYDEMWDGEEGNITRYEWDFDSDGIPDAFTEMIKTGFFEEPGEYTLNLTVWDWVGHKSDNFTQTIYVDDVTPPDAMYTIMNSTGVETNFPLEKETIYFNASDSSDNFSSKENLTYEWEIDGNGKNGENVSHVFDEPGEVYVNLTVIDEAGNEGYHNLSVIVADDPRLHSHISCRNSLVFDPEDPEVGQTVKMRVEVANTDQGMDATNVTVAFWIVEEEDKKIDGTVKYFNGTGSPITTIVIPAGGNITAEISWKPGSHGDYTIMANCTADNELSTGSGDNTIQGDISVQEAQWVTTAIIAVFVVLIFVIAIILLFRRKFAGRFPKLSREKKDKKQKKEKKKKKVKK